MVLSFLWLFSVKLYSIAPNSVILERIWTSLLTHPSLQVLECFPERPECGDHAIDGVQPRPDSHPFLQAKGCEPVSVLHRAEQDAISDEDALGG